MCLKPEGLQQLKAGPASRSIWEAALCLCALITSSEARRHRTSLALQASSANWEGQLVTALADELNCSVRLCIMSDCRAV